MKKKSNDTQPAQLEVNLCIYTFETFSWLIKIIHLTLTVVILECVRSVQMKSESELSSLDATVRMKREGNN